MQIARKIISILLVLIICFCAAGCGNTPKKKKKVVIIKKRRPTSSASETVSDQSSSELSNGDISFDNSDVSIDTGLNSDGVTSENVDSGTLDSEIPSTDSSVSDNTDSNFVDSETTESDNLNSDSVESDEVISDSTNSETDSDSQNSNVDNPNDNQEGTTDDGYTEDAYKSERELAEKETTKTEEIKKEYNVNAIGFKVTDEYTVIYPDGDEQLRQSAQKLVDYFNENGIKIKMASDAIPQKDEEILIGDTNRKKSTLKDNEYAVSVSNKQLVFESGNFNGVIKAVSWFTSFDYNKKKINTIKGEYEFSSKIKREDGTYEFVWGDEFDGNALNMSNWDFTSSISAESSFKLSRDPQAVNVSDGLLKLSAMRWFDPDNNQIQAIAPYTIEGKKHMNFQYGYLEMRARIPFGGGAWPSLWLSGACKSEAVVSSLFEKGDIIPSNFSAEFDIVEYTTLQPNLHKWFYDDAEGIDGVEGIVNKHSSLGAVEKPVKSDIGLDINQSYVYILTVKSITHTTGKKVFNLTD